MCILRITLKLLAMQQHNVKVYFVLTTADESHDEVSTGAVVAITFVITFLITLVVTTLITYIIISLYYKYQYELKEKVKVHDDKNVNTKQDPYGGNITMDTNPAYGTTYYYHQNGY